MALAAVLVLAFGLVTGWMIRADSNDEGGVMVRTADGSELTVEQGQMWAMLEQYANELITGDYEAAESWFFDDGGIRVLDGSTFRTETSRQYFRAPRG